jgi:hypothetical protein
VSGRSGSSASATSSLEATSTERENQRNVTKAIVLSAALREDTLDSFPEKNP